MGVRGLEVIEFGDVHLHDSCGCRLKVSRLLYIIRDKKSQLMRVHGLKASALLTTFFSQLMRVRGLKVWLSFILCFGRNLRVCVD
mgnify:CR=1 FL=1